MPDLELAGRDRESVAAHPLARLHRAGVPVTLNTDDTTVSDITLSEEYLGAVETIGLTLPELWAIDRHALDVRSPTRRTWRRCGPSSTAWGAGIPELARTDRRGPDGHRMIAHGTFHP